MKEERMREWIGGERDREMERERRRETERNKERRRRGDSHYTQNIFPPVLSMSLTCTWGEARTVRVQWSIEQWSIE